LAADDVFPGGKVFGCPWLDILQVVDILGGEESVENQAV
jgi:hypothetical protein